MTLQTCGVSGNHVEFDSGGVDADVSVKIVVW